MLARVCVPSLYWQRVCAPRRALRPSLLRKPLLPATDLPVDGHWRIRFAFFVPAFASSSVPGAIFPAEGLATTSPEDSVEVGLGLWFCAVSFQVVWCAFKLTSRDDASLWLDRWRLEGEEV